MHLKWLPCGFFIVILNGWYQWRSTTLPLNFPHSFDVPSLCECPTSIAEAPFASQNRKLGSNRPQRLCMRAWLGSQTLSYHSEEGLNPLSSKPTIGLNHIPVNSCCNVECLLSIGVFYHIAEATILQKQKPIKVCVVVIFTPIITIVSGFQRNELQGHFFSTHILNIMRIFGVTFSVSFTLSPG